MTLVSHTNTVISEIQLKPHAPLIPSSSLCQGPTIFRKVQILYEALKVIYTTTFTQKGRKITSANFLTHANSLRENIFQNSKSKENWFPRTGSTFLRTTAPNISHKNTVTNISFLFHRGV